jgi:hypothetical protein
LLLILGIVKALAIKYPQKSSKIYNSAPINWDGKWYISSVKEKYFVPLKYQRYIF